MNAAKHTPGPWVVCVQDESPWRAHDVFAEHQLENGRISADEWDSSVASAGLNHENYDANARLIAAAPEMLAVLQELQESASYWSEYDVPLGIVARINSAIAKATGEKPC